METQLSLSQRKELSKGRSLFGELPQTVQELIFSYIDNPSDRGSVSVVSKEWHQLDRRTRKFVTIASCYSVEPSRLTRRFQALEAVKIKGKPRAAMFKLVPDEWGGHARDWISEISRNCPFLKSVHLRRMIVTDCDLFTLAKSHGPVLQVLKLEKCTGFTTAGLQVIARSCRPLKVLFLEESYIKDNGEPWLHELSLHCSSLEVLNFTGTELAMELDDSTITDLATIASNCRSLTSLKLNELALEKLSEMLRGTTGLKELGGVSLGDFDNPEDQNYHPKINLPTTLTSLVRLCYMGMDDGDDVVNSLIQPIAPGLRKLDLQYACMSINGHCQVLSHCAKLEALEVFNAIGDEGLEVIANNCKNLKWLRVERGEQGFVTQKGLISVASNCFQLEYIAAYVSDINNEALETIAINCPNLKDFRLVLLEEEHQISETRLDRGVRTLMQRCPQLHRLGLYLRPGFLSDRGLEEVGLYGKNLKWILFGLVGETDMGLRLFANGCPKLERLEIRDSLFSEAAIAESVLKMKTLKYVWIQGYQASKSGKDLLPLTKNYWNVELIHEENASAENGNEDATAENDDTIPAQFLAYRSLAGKREDAPRDIVTCLG